MLNLLVSESGRASLQGITKDGGFLQTSDRKKSVGSAIISDAVAQSHNPDSGTATANSYRDGQGSTVTSSSLTSAHANSQAGSDSVQQALTESGGAAISKTTATNSGLAPTIHHLHYVGSKHKGHAHAEPTSDDQSSGVDDQTEDGRESADTATMAHSNGHSLLHSSGTSSTKVCHHACWNPNAAFNLRM